MTAASAVVGDALSGSGGAPSRWSAEVIAAGALSFVVWASCSTAGLLDVGPVTIRPIDLGQLVLLLALLPLLRQPGRHRELVAGRWSLAAGALLLLVVLASAAWVALDEPGARAVVLPSAVRVLQLGVVAVAAAWLARTWVGKRLLLQALTAGAFVVSVLYALAHVGLTGPLELLDLNPGKSAVGPVAVGSLVLALMVHDVAVRYRLVLGALCAVNLLFAVSMTAYLATIVVLPVLVWVVLRLREVPLRVQVAVVVAVALLCTSYAYVGLRVLRPDALPSRIDAPLTLAPGGKAPIGPEGPGVQPPAATVEDGSEVVAGATILHRAILMSTAFELFKESPVTGVGWTRGDDLGVVDDPEIVAEMKQRFPSGYDTLFTDVSPLGAHNALLQVLAELGLVGAIPLLALIALLVLSTRRATRRAGCNPSEVAAAATCYGLAGAAFVFLMFTGLYPGQVESLLAAAAVGAAAMVPRRAGAPA